MTPQEFVGLRKWITARWPAGRIWGSDDNSAEIYHDFASLPAEMAYSAAHNIYIDGAKHPPNPSELIAATRRVIAESGSPGEYRKPCAQIDGHAWAILEYGKEGDDSVRLVQCARCGEGPEWRQVKTMGEITKERENR